MAKTKLSLSLSVCCVCVLSHSLAWDTNRQIENGVCKNEFKNALHECTTILAINIRHDWEFEHKPSGKERANRICDYQARLNHDSREQYDMMVYCLDTLASCFLCVCVCVHLSELTIIMLLFKNFPQDEPIIIIIFDNRQIEVQHTYCVADCRYDMLGQPIIRCTLNKCQRPNCSLHSFWLSCWTLNIRSCIHNVFFFCILSSFQRS